MWEVEIEDQDVGPESTQRGNHLPAGVHQGALQLHQAEESVQHFPSGAVSFDYRDAANCEHREPGAMLLLLQWLLLILPFEIEEIVSPDLFARQTAAGRCDRHDAAPRRLHPSHPDPQQMLTAVSDRKSTRLNSSH